MKGLRIGFSVVILCLIFATVAGAQGIVTPDWNYQGEGAGEQLGKSVAILQDANGDGYSDLAIGSPHYNCYYGGDLYCEGKITVCYGGPDGLSDNCWVWTSGTWRGFAGSSIADAGDVNGDGYSDLVASNGMGWEVTGKLWIFYGSESGYSDSKMWEYTYLENSGYGVYVGKGGDFNNDGFNDVPIVATINTHKSHVHVLYGSAKGISQIDWSSDLNGSDGWLGSSLGSVGDINGDSVDDLYVGAVNMGYGMAFLYNGSSDFDKTRDWQVEAPIPTEYPTHSFAAQNCGGWAGDLNNDTYNDLVIGAPTYSNGQEREGAIFIYYGGPRNPDITPTIIESNYALPDNGAYFGSVFGAGDTNGDGYGDLVVGAHRYTEGIYRQGRVYLYTGNNSNKPDLSWAYNGSQANSYLGLAVTGGGDFNGDGLADVVSGAPQHNLTTPYSSEGVVYAFYGKGVPTTVFLTHFEANAKNKFVQVMWKTDSQLDSLGFNLYRSENQNGASKVRLNEELIPNKTTGGSVSPMYTYKDNTAQLGVQYYYWLESVGINDQVELHGPVGPVGIKRLPSGDRPATQDW